MELEILVLFLSVIILLLGDISIIGTAIFMAGICFVVYLVNNQKHPVDRCILFGRLYYKKGNKVQGILRELSLLSNNQYRLVISLPNVQDPVSITSSLNYLCASTLEAAYKQARQLDDPLPIFVLEYDDGYGGKQYLVPDNWDSDLPCIHEIRVIQFMKKPKTPDELALIMRFISELIIPISILLLFTNEKAAILLLITGISGLLLFVPSSKTKLTNITKCGIIESLKKEKTSSDSSKTTESVKSADHEVSKSATPPDTSERETEPTRFEHSSGRKTTPAMSTIQTLTQKYHASASIESQHTADLKKESACAVEPIISSEKLNFDASHNSLECPETDQISKGASRKEDEPTPTLQGQKQSGSRKKPKATSSKASKSSRSRKRKQPTNPSPDGEQMSFLTSTSDFSDSSDTEDTHDTVQQAVQDDRIDSSTANDEGLKETVQKDSHLEDGPLEDGPLEDGPLEDGPLEDGPLEDGPLEDGPLEDGPLEDGPLEDGSLEDGPLEDGSLEDGPLEDDLSIIQDQFVSDEETEDVLPDTNDSDQDDISIIGEPIDADFTSIDTNRDNVFIASEGCPPQPSGENIEVIPQEDIVIMPEKKYRRNLYGDTLMKRRSDDTPTPVSFVIDDKE